MFASGRPVLIDLISCEDRVLLVFPTSENKELNERRATHEPTPHQAYTTTLALTYQDTVRFTIYTMLLHNSNHMFFECFFLFHIYCRKLVAFTCASYKSNVFENKRRDCSRFFHVCCTYTDSYKWKLYTHKM